MGKDDGITHAFRNIPGVELADVNSLNLLQLAPGGHLGRFCVWSQGAFERLDALFGTHKKASTEKTRHKAAYRLPQLQMINSDEIQSKVNAPKEGTKPAVLKRNPLKVPSVMEELNPAAAVAKKRAIDKEKAAVEAKAALVAQRRAGTAPSRALPAEQKELKKSFFSLMSQ